jgi:hypothetical protein
MDFYQHVDPCEGLFFLVKTHFYWSMPIFQLITKLVLVSFFQFSVQTICIPWSKTSVKIEQSNHTVFFTIRSSLRTGWTGFGVSNTKDLSFRSKSLYFNIHEYGELTNHRENSSQKIFTNLQLVDGLYMSLNNEKSLTFQMEDRELLNMSFVYFAEHDSTMNHTFHQRFHIRQYDILLALKEYGEPLLRFITRFGEL